MSLLCCQAKVADEDLGAVLTAQDVLGLEVSMEDAHVVAGINRIDKLEEDRPHEHVISPERREPGHIHKQIAARAILQNEEEIIFLFKNTVYGDNTLMICHSEVEPDLQMLQLIVPAPFFSLGQTFDSVLLLGAIQSYLAFCKEDNSVRP